MRRFVALWRSDGAAAALARAREYLVARRGGAAPGTIRPAPGCAGAPYLGGVWQSLAQAGAFHVSTAPARPARQRRIALIGDLNLPQCRKYRAEQLAEFWALHDVEFAYAHYLDLPRAVQLMQQATHLTLYRLRSGPEVSMLLYEARRLRLPVLYDIDDPLFSVSAYETYANMAALGSEAHRRFVQEAPAYLDVMNACDMVSVSTPALADHARLHTPRPVVLRRNFADAATLAAGRRAMQAAQDRDGLFRVAFASGSRGHEADFAPVAADIAAFMEGDPRRRLMILGHFDRAHLPAGLAARTEWRRFAGYGDYLGALARADCAILPLADDSFNRCKSAARALDAAAVGVPVLCAAVGDSPAVIRNGQTGFVIDKPGGWADALARLARDPSGARAMGLRARRDAERRWSAQDAAHVADAALAKWVSA
ncbi:glycosyltransferase [Roseovarius spongiae]|uniref:glycosyltransferase n=1 Tax=Roseovarius spongiae TaxID=2320272 RepID=UPI00140751A5|nr:glycosyltransferase [Roseovarius spongiae]